MASRSTSLLRPLLRSTPKPSSHLRIAKPHQPPTRTLTLCHRLRTPSFPTQSTSLATASVPSTTRPYSNGGKPTGKASGKSEGDLLVEELQELYEVATDEFEIASDSTSNATIYAASDRESARDALNQLLVVYSLYTTEVTAPEFQELQKQQEPQQGKQANVEGETSRVVATNFNPVEVSDVARAEVKRRVGQRVRELRSAVEVLEERAKED